MPFVLSSDEQGKLLRWARLAIVEAVGQEPRTPVPPGEITGLLSLPHAAFVTLKLNGSLRGCIGYMDFSRPLWENIINAAAASAMEDPRFAPVQAEELPAIRLEISILETPVALPRVGDFDPLVHGIIVERGGKSALLLPKVAQEWGWSADQVLNAVCEKAGLSRYAWREPKTRLQTFTAFDFAESPVS